MGRATSPARSPWPWSVGGHPVALVTGDFNHDKISDLATSDFATGTVSILLGRADGTFQDAQHTGSAKARLDSRCATSIATGILMPQMNGVRLAKLALEVRKDLKVLFISGYTNNILENYGNFESSAAFLSKPVSPRVLAAKVRDVIDSPAGKAVC